MSAPAGWVLSCAVSPRLCCIENSFDASAYAAGRFGLRLPDRLQDVEDMRGANFCNRQLADFRINIVGQGIPPLLTVLAAAPAALISGDIRLGDGIEGNSGYLSG